MDPNTSERISNAAMSLVEEVSTAGKSQLLNLQNTTNQHLVDVKEDLATIKESIADLKEVNERTDKHRRITFAIQNVALLTEKFDCQKVAQKKDDLYDNDTIYSEYLNSSRTKDLITNILFTFQQGLGYYIDTYCFIDGNEGDATIINVNSNWFKVFQDRLTNELHKLLGKKPSMRFYDGKMAVFYQ